MHELGAWRPPSVPRLEGPLAPNRALSSAALWPALDGVGPEDVAVDAEGRVYSGLADGRILRWPAGGGTPTVVASTGGRPLGIEVDRDGSLVVCDARRGLLRVRPGADDVRVLADRHRGAPLRFTNNAAIARDGTIYFSDSSTAYGIDEWREDLLLHQPLGRLFALAPGATEPRLLLDGLHFANGVALSADESFVVVCETARYCLTKVPLDGSAPSTLNGNLPGFPDNLSSSPRGTFWVPIASPRDGVLDFLLPRPRLRKLVTRIPERLQPQPRRYGMVVEVDARGTVLRALHDPTGRVAMVTGVREHGGTLYLGSLTEPAVAVVSL